MININISPGYTPTGTSISFFQDILLNCFNFDLLNIIDIINIKSLSKFFYKLDLLQINNIITLRYKNNRFDFLKNYPHNNNTIFNNLLDLYKYENNFQSNNIIRFHVYIIKKNYFLPVFVLKQCINWDTNIIEILKICPLFIYDFPENYQIMSANISKQIFNNNNNYEYDFINIDINKTFKNELGWNYKKYYNYIDQKYWQIIRIHCIIDY
tara:strand:- start:5099 stop:5731 length:633 start_codon:yes stop_codon:yes gene_type:complete